MTEPASARIRFAAGARTPAAVAAEPRLRKKNVSLFRGRSVADRFGKAMDETRILHIKNMVCNRCVMVVTRLLERLELHPVRVVLGEAELSDPLPVARRDEVRRALEECGFELLDDPRDRLVERIRTAVIELVHYDASAARVNLSDYLAERCHADYSLLSKLFTEACGTTVERYYIAQKIERVKELLSEGELSVGEIADLLHYSSVAHLSAQFRRETGLTPSAFRRLGEHVRCPLDEVK